MIPERWPVVYDANELAKLINKLPEAKDFFENFYHPNKNNPKVCQGDIVSFTSGVPHFDKQHMPRVTENEVSDWLIIGNSCDFSRAISQVTWTQIVPIHNLGESSELGSQLNDIQSYKSYRGFYLPAWEESRKDFHFIADFLSPVSIHKEAFDNIKVRARMEKTSWVLLHSCLVRFLARDDGRFDF